MKTWKHIFNIKEDFKRAEDNKISVKDFSKLIAEKIVNSTFYSSRDIGLCDIVEEFNNLGEATWDDFDCIWDQFYDWADINEVWIEVF